MARSLDWPLSREEKKSRVLTLYDKDVEAAELLLRDYARKLKQAQSSWVEVQKSESSDGHPDEKAIRGKGKGSNHGAIVAAVAAAALESAAKPSTPTTTSGHIAYASEPCSTLARRSEEGISARDVVVESIRMTVSGAAAALGALLGGHGQDAVLDGTETPDMAEEVLPSRLRARSEGASKVTSVRPALCQTPRKRRMSRGGEPLRVKFVGEDEEADKLSNACSQVETKEFDADQSDRTFDPAPEPEPQPEIALDRDGEGQQPQDEQFRGRSLVVPGTGEGRSTGLNSRSPGSRRVSLRSEDDEEEAASRRDARRAKLRGRLHGYSG
eukprot:TRINITY_DN36677_c0_g1_i1.p1 TRINITY_DN36677_c0_g1~~TRINITY_DN36677_c0_g1_i1.p1  ORF type:complete len:327 (-),score=83.95 TRINITY_DN36677_c0_g1_i1:123-1103(-)